MKKKNLILTLTAVMLAFAIGVGGTIAYFTDTTESKVNAFTVGNVDITLTEPAWSENDNHTLMPGSSYAKDPTITVAENSQDAYVFLKVDMNKYVSLINLMGVDAYKNVDSLKNEGAYPGFIAFVNKLATDNTLRATVLDRWFTGINHADWKVMNANEILEWVNGAADQTNPKKLEVVLGYIGSDDDTLSAGKSVKFMTAFGMPNSVTASMFDGEDAYYVGEGENRHSASNFNTAVNPETGKVSTFKMTFTAYAIQKAEIANIDAAYAELFGKN